MSITWKAKWNEVGYFLKGFREWRGESLEDVSDRFKKLLSGGQGPSAVVDELRVTFRNVKQSFSVPLGFLKKLENGRTSGPDLSRGSVRLLAEGYDLPALMLDPLFSRVLHKGELCFHDSTDKMHLANDSSKYYGTKIEYRIPSCRLPDCPDVGFGHLSVRGGGRSDTHDHPGTELIFVLDGPSIEVCFDSSGLRIPLQKGEGAHFRAEIPHSIYNPHVDDTKGRSSVFVVRFYQLHTESTWQKTIRLIESIEGVLKKYEKGIKAARKHAKDVDYEGVCKALPVIPVESDHSRPHNRFSPFVKSLTTRVKSADLKRLREGQPESVADHFGLAQMLERIKEQKGLTLDKLAQCKGFPRAKLSDILHSNAGTLTRGDLEILGNQFGIETMLLASFLYPSEPDVIALRQTDMGLVPETWTGAGVRYLVPRCNLSLSDMNLLIVELEAQRETKVNHHPGFELLIPLTPGPIEVEFLNVADETKATTFRCAENDYAYYSSVNPHRIKNPGTDAARVFVVRFYGWAKA